MAPFLLALALGGAEPPTPDLSWLAGYWLSCEEEEVSESWSDPRGGMALGAGMTLGRGGKVSWEMMRIGPSPAGLSFFAQPSGQPAAEFPLSASGERKLVFENKAHDFPQRVLYWRDGEQLRARIEGELNGRAEAMDWRYRKAALNERCPAKG